ncbi:MAG TPA: S41 family peptidase [Candidatus Saccharimonadales bacterium]
MGISKKTKIKDESTKNRRWVKISTISVVSLLILAGVFFVGVNFGNGRFRIGGTHPITGLPAKLNYTTVNQVYRSLRDNYDGQLSETQVLDGIKHGVANSANDPYTEYFTPTEAKAFNNELNSTFSGIGAELSQTATNQLEVIAPVTGSPAAKAGLQDHDMITTINGKTTTGLTTDEAVNLIRGNAGTKVTLGILRGTNAFELTITRENITLPSVTYKVMAGNIGYIQINTFADDTSALIKQAATSLTNQHVKGIVLDLRDNPGGLLTAAVDVSSQWLKQGDVIMQEKRGNEVVATYNASGADSLYGIPTVVLINGGSASSSEITTGALHDNGAAYVIGTKSFGKGVVQQLISFNNGSQLKVTVASWYRPNGQSINKKGITPDEVVTITPQDIAAGNDTQLNAAINYLNSH